MKIAIFGSGKQAVLVASILSTQGHKIIGHIDIIDHSPNCNIIGHPSEIKKLVDKFYIEGAIIGVGLNSVRKKIAIEVNNQFNSFNWISCIDEASNIHDNVKIGEGVTILGNSSIFGHSQIGNHVLLNNSTSLNHDNHFCNYSSTGPGVITGGDVKVGESSYIGINSCIKQGIEIGNNVVVGANSFVNKDIQNNQLGYGSPFKVVRQIEDDENYLT
jgi:acetyltransferase EpsM